VQRRFLLCDRDEDLAFEADVAQAALVPGKAGRTHVGPDPDLAVLPAQAQFGVGVQRRLAARHLEAAFVVEREGQRVTVVAGQPGAQRQGAGRPFQQRTGQRQAAPGAGLEQQLRHVRRQRVPGIEGVQAGDDGAVGMHLGVFHAVDVHHAGFAVRWSGAGDAAPQGDA
jgi:hypothetical protein